MPSFSIVNLSSDAVTFIIVAVSLYFVTKQRPSQFPYVRNLLILVHVFFEGVIVMEVVRNVVTTEGVIDWYTNIATTFILWDVVLLTAISYAVYLRPGGKGLMGRTRAIFFRWPHGLILACFTVFIAATEIYLLFYHPYSEVRLSTLDDLFLSSQIYLPDTAFNATFLNLTFVTLVFFFAYPTVLLIRATLQVKDPDVRRALVVLPFCWGGIGAELFVFNGYLVSLGYDLVAIGYVIAAVVFGVAASIFRRATLLSTFFEPLAATGGVQVPKLDERPGAPLPGATPVLMEVDPSTSYERAIKGYAAVGGSKGTLTYVFTSKGSPLYHSLTGVAGVRFYLMTSQVSYPRPSDVANELLVPENDIAVILDLLDKTIASTGESQVLLVFDSVSNYIMYMGFESAYKFVKQANEILSQERVTSVYLVTTGAHDDKQTNLIRSLFRMHMAYDKAGLHVTKGVGELAA